MMTKKYLLIGSLCLNLLLIGLIGGGAWRGHNDKAANLPQNEFMAIARFAPAETRENIREKLRELSPRKGDPEGRAGIEKLTKLIGAQPFDVVALTTYFEAKRNAASDATTAAHSVVVAELAAMDDEERAELAENLTKRIKHWDGRRKSHGDKSDK